MSFLLVVAGPVHAEYVVTSCSAVLLEIALAQLA